MTRHRSTIVHCFARKLEVVCDDYESVHGPGTFVGSPEWQATLHPDWRDGTCLLAMGHVDGCRFTDDNVRSERKVS